jgi:uncharacterized protein (TIGR00251 family)
VVLRPAAHCHPLPAFGAPPFAPLFAPPPKSELLRRRQDKRDSNSPRGTGTTARLKVKVVPGSSRNQIVGWLGAALKIKVTAPPEKGQANEAVVELLSSTLGVSTKDIEVFSGHSSPSKIVAITGMDDEAIKKAFG